MNFTPPENPKVSIIIASFNTGKFVKDTMDSVLAQTSRSFEVIVVDGASTDETLSVLEDYSGIRIISEPDSGYLEAFRKGLKLARGKYVMQCAISDGFLEKTWIDECVKVLDADEDVSLVWGLPQYMDEQGALGGVSYPQFQRRDPPQKEDFFYYWLATFFWLPEGNFCARKGVMEECFPPFVSPAESKKLEPWLEFNFSFQEKGYLPFFLRMTANYGRIHGGQLGQREIFSGAAEKKYELYVGKARSLRHRIMWGEITHVYRGGRGSELASQFSRRRFVMSELVPPSKIARNMSLFFKNVMKRGIFWLARKEALPKSVKDAIIARREANFGIKDGHHVS